MSCPQEAEALLWFLNCVEKMKNHLNAIIGEHFNTVVLLESTPGDRWP